MTTRQKRVENISDNIYFSTVCIFRMHWRVNDGQLTRYTVCDFQVCNVMQIPNESNVVIDNTHEIYFNGMIRYCDYGACVFQYAHCRLAFFEVGQYRLYDAPWTYTGVCYKMSREN